MLLATAAQMRGLDDGALTRYGIKSAELMEKAGGWVADATIELVGYTGRAVCFCGGGSNGGDGLVAARLLLERGWQVRAMLVGGRDRQSAACRAMEQLLTEKGGVLEDFPSGDAEFAAWCLGCDVMIDALFGTGLNRKLEGDALIAIQMMNTCAIPVVAVDIASGVEADSGRILGAAVEATVTVTFTLAKPGHFVGKGGLCCGTLRVEDIGIPRALVDEGDYPTRAVERSDIHLPRRAKDAHKGNFGKAYIVGGSMGMSGAPVMAAQAAVRTGAGMVTAGVPYQLWPIAAAKLDEAMAQPLPAGKEGMLELGAALTVLERLGQYGVCLIGPGLGHTNAVFAVVRNILAGTKLPVVLDADGINALEGHIDSLDGRSGQCTILTPHDAEFKRIGGDLSSGDRLKAARAFAVEHSCCIVLKGHRTITAFPDGTAYVNTTGNPGMAKGGSGDVLAGILVALLAQGFTPREAAPVAVWIHGCAGDLCAEELGEYGMAPTDIIRKLPCVLKELVCGQPESRYAAEQDLHHA